MIGSASTKGVECAQDEGRYIDKHMMVEYSIEESKSSIEYSC